MIGMTGRAARIAHAAQRARRADIGASYKPECCSLLGIAEMHLRNDHIHSGCRFLFTLFVHLLATCKTHGSCLWSEYAIPVSQVVKSCHGRRRFRCRHFSLPASRKSAGLSGKYVQKPDSGPVAIQQLVSLFHQSSAIVRPRARPWLSIRSIVRYLLSGSVCFCRYAGLVIY